MAEVANNKKHDCLQNKKHVHHRLVFGKWAKTFTAAIRSSLEEL